ncbi:MAG TPA: hypothetical protein VH186_35515 [Chloroflexia bacterium]|nr:hypothetical protein [Chloroflexia bacterium]
MGMENTSYAEGNDVTTQLAKLVDAGWNEAQIAKMARMRASYGQTRDIPREELPEELSTEDQNHLEFIRWLHQNGRIKG